MHNFNTSICYKSSSSGLQTIKVTFFILLFLFVPPFLPFACVSPLCLPGAVIPMQRVGVSVLRRRARALVENESEQRFHRGRLWTHQSYPKTSELSQNRRQNIPSWDSSDVFPGGFASNFFSQHQAAFLGHRWRNSHSFAKITLGMPT